jgi:hypothetical protein
MLFHKRTKKIINAFWLVVAILVMISMVLLYTPFWR